MVLLNATEVVHEWYGTPRGKLLQIEAFICVTVFILACLVILGSSRRRFYSGALRLLIQAFYGLSFILITYTMGQMHLASFQNELFAIWGVFLLIVYGSADGISAYSLEDNEQWKKHHWELLAQLFWMGWLIGLYDTETKFLVPLVLLSLVTLWKTNERIQAFVLASKDGLVRMTKLTADFMSYEHELSNPQDIDPIHMRGYKYIVAGEKEKFVSILPPLYKSKLAITDEVITVEKVWQCKGRLLSTSEDPDSKLKDLCLSFALYRLLCRRFAGYPLPECLQEKTWKFVREGLLQEGGDYERPFRVIEEELAFLYDLFYTKYAVIFRDAKLKVTQFFTLVLGCYFAVTTLSHYNEPKNTYLHIVTKGGHNIDALVTGIAITVILFSEIVQLLLFVISNWGKVLLLYKYVQKPSWQESTSYEKIVRLASSIPWLKPWGSKLGQYSLLKSFNHNPSIWNYNCFTSDFIENPGRGHTGDTRVNLPEEVKKAVIAWIRNKGRSLTNGIESLCQNKVKIEFSWACRLESHTQVIMVWHIATILCEFRASLERSKQSGEARHPRPEEQIVVATTLSKYCAYLVVFAPRLLPDHAYVAESIFNQIVKETEKFLEGCSSMESKYQRMMSVSKEEPGETVIQSGAELARQLIEEVGDEEKIWKMLADFWTEMVLFVAPSDDVNAHAQYLARGGEFVTHLWALLFHAGIVQRNPVHEQS